MAGHTSLPHTPTNLILTIASVGSVILGSGLSSIFASPGPYRNTDGLANSLGFFGGGGRGGGDGACFGVAALKLSCWYIEYPSWIVLIDEGSESEFGMVTSFRTPYTSCCSLCC